MVELFSVYWCHVAKNHRDCKRVFGDPVTGRITQKEREAEIALSLLFIYETKTSLIAGGLLEVWIYIQFGLWNGIESFTGRLVSQGTQFCFGQVPSHEVEIPFSFQCQFNPAFVNKGSKDVIALLYIGKNGRIATTGAFSYHVNLIDGLSSVANPVCCFSISQQDFGIADVLLVLLMAFCKVFHRYIDHIFTTAVARFRSPGSFERNVGHLFGDDISFLDDGIPQAWVARFEFIHKKPLE